MENFTVRDLIVETVNKLFIHTDEQAWGQLQHEVFTEQVLFDMSSLGGQQAELSAKEICATWQQGFAGIDSVNHLAGNYLVDIKGDAATVFAYATATHYKASATKGNTREFVGTYHIGLIKLAIGWRINAFKYNLKYANGNMELV